MRNFILLLLLFAGATSFAQSELLAKNYLDKGAYEKAISLYEKLYKESPHKTEFLESLVEAYQQLEQFNKAETLLKERLEGRRYQPQYFIDLGYNYALQDQDSLAQINYTKSVESLNEKPNYATIISKKFESYSLLDFAVASLEKGMELNPNLNANLQLARIYGEQGKVELMFTKYIALMETRPNYKSISQRNFSRYVTEDPENEANILLRKILLKKLQENPDVLYNELLSWLFIQQKDFKKAFTQEKAIYKRTEEGLGGITDLALITLAEKDYENAANIINYVIENSATTEAQLQGYQYLMKVKLATATENEYPEIEATFKELLNQYGNGTKTYLLQIDYNHFLAFQARKSDIAIENLKTLANEKLSAYHEARVKMELADILVFEERFNRALIYYTQIQKKVKSDVIAQEARFKVARTSYFKGDFVWAKTQLDVLRKSASQLIANDAIELSLMIHDNTQEDSLHTALKKYAKADLLALQNKDKEAITILAEILTVHKGEKIEDETLLKQGGLYEKTGDYKKAEENYLTLIDLFKEDILADDAYFRLANLYEKQLLNPTKAKEYYEQIIFNFEDSIYFIEARKKYRMLRGDEIE